MKTITKHQTHTAEAAAPKPKPKLTSEPRPVPEVGAGLVEILTMHVGCWSPPIYIDITSLLRS